MDCFNSTERLYMLYQGRGPKASPEKINLLIKLSYINAIK